MDSISNQILTPYYQTNANSQAYSSEDLREIAFQLRELNNHIQGIRGVYAKISKYVENDNVPRVKEIVPSMKR